MIATTRYLILLALITAMSTKIVGQTSFASITDTSGMSSSCKPPIARQIFHDYIKNEQTAILNSDGKKDKQFTPSSNPEINLLLTRSLINKVDALRCRIEGDSTLNQANKVRYLR